MVFGLNDIILMIPNVSSVENSSDVSCSSLVSLQLYHEQYFMVLAHLEDTAVLSWASSITQACGGCGFDGVLSYELPILFPVIFRVAHALQQS